MILGVTPLRIRFDMKSDKPFQKSFACGGVLFAVIILILQ
jgi:hypothetical protein